MIRILWARTPIRLAIALLILFVSQISPVWAEGKFQENPATGCKVWNPNPQPGESFTWTGACKDGYLSGHGIFEWIVE